MENKIKFQLGDSDFKCKLLYRPYDIDAFDELRNNEYHDIVVITYTSAKTLKTVFNKIESTFKHAKKVDLVIGISHPVYIEKWNDKPKYKAQKEQEIQKFKENFINSLKEISKEVKKNDQSSFWKNVNLNFTLHNHCHIKYIDAGPFCFAGSQNFTGMIDKKNIETNYTNNELIISILGSLEKKKSITHELMLCLHHEKDEYIQLSQDAIKSEEFSPSSIYEQLKIKRESSANRKSFDEIFKLLEDEGFSNAVQEYMEEKKIYEQEQKFVPPEVFQYYSQIDTLLYEDHKYPLFEGLEEEVSALESVVSKLEYYIGDTVVSDKIEELLEQFSSVPLLNFPSQTYSNYKQVITDSTPCFISNIQKDFSYELTQLILNTKKIAALSAKKALYLSVLLDIQESMKSLLLDDLENFKDSYVDQIIQTFADDPESASSTERETSHNADDWSDTAQNFGNETFNSADIFDYLPEVEESLIENIQESMAKVATELSIVDI